MSDHRDISPCSHSASESKNPSAYDHCANGRRSRSSTVNCSSDCARNCQSSSSRAEANRPLNTASGLASPIDFSYSRLRFVRSAFSARSCSLACSSRRFSACASVSCRCIVRIVVCAEGTESTVSSSDSTGTSASVLCVCRRDRYANASAMGSHAGPSGSTLGGSMTVSAGDGSENSHSPASRSSICSAIVAPRENTGRISASVFTAVPANRSGPRTTTSTAGESASAGYNMNLSMSSHTYVTRPATVTPGTYARNASCGLFHSGTISNSPVPAAYPRTCCPLRSSVSSGCVSTIVRGSSIIVALRGVRSSSARTYAAESSTISTTPETSARCGACARPVFSLADAASSSSLGLPAPPTL